MHGTNTARTTKDPNLATPFQIEQARVILALAARVEEIAGPDGRPAGRFGDRKVFISSVCDVVLGFARGDLVDQVTYHRLLDELAICSRSGSESVSRELREILVRLLPLHDETGAPILVMARADLVAALDPEAVRRSEILDRGASFHFVVDRTRDPQAYGRARR